MSHQIESLARDLCAARGADWRDANPHTQEGYRAEARFVLENYRAIVLGFVAEASGDGLAALRAEVQALLARVERLEGNLAKLAGYAADGIRATLDVATLSEKLP